MCAPHHTVHRAGWVRRSRGRGVSREETMSTKPGARRSHGGIQHLALFAGRSKLGRVAGNGGRARGSRHDDGVLSGALPPGSLLSANTCRNKNTTNTHTYTELTAPSTAASIHFLFSYALCPSLVQTSHSLRTLPRCRTGVRPRPTALHSRALEYIFRSRGVVRLRAACPSLHVRHVSIRVRSFISRWTAATGSIPFAAAFHAPEIG
jgi:hypothetical protein